MTLIYVTIYLKYVKIKWEKTKSKNGINIEHMCNHCLNFLFDAFGGNSMFSLIKVKASTYS